VVILATVTWIVPVYGEAAEPGSTLGDALLFNQKRLGDLDKMVKERTIRALVVYSKTFFFLDRGRQRGSTYELLKEFEKFVNKKLKTKKTGNPCRVYSRPA
jgi:membrane-bound lytic murein transglycosylase MltF